MIFIKLEIVNTLKFIHKAVFLLLAYQLIARFLTIYEIFKKSKINLENEHKCSYLYIIINNKKNKGHGKN